MTKLLFFIPFLVVSFSNFAQQTNAEKIDWPAKYEPNKSNFYVHNEIEINAKSEIVWGLLVAALQWETWYKGARNVVFANPAQTVLTANSVFKWQTMGLTFQSTIKQFEPYRLLAWESQKKKHSRFSRLANYPNRKGLHSHYRRVTNWLANLF